MPSETSLFADKVVAITGGSRGLGRAMALGFARAGASLAIASRKIEACHATVREIEALGGKASAHAAHVGKWADCDRLAAEVYERWGRCDVLINNAGLSPVAPSLLETGEDLFDKVIGVNVKGPFRLGALFGTRMKKAGGGAIINISSIAAIRPDQDVAPYAIAKSGLNALTIALAKEYSPEVRVNCIMAGPYHTDISASWSHTDEFAEFARQSIPLGRAGHPEEIVGAVMYLAGPTASYTTATVMTVDGGASHPLARGRESLGN